MNTNTDPSAHVGRTQTLDPPNRARRRWLLAALVLVSLVSISLLSSADQTNEEKKLTGTWLVSVRSPDSPPSAPPLFFGLLTYFEDGNMIQESTGPNFLPSTFRSAGHGKWKRTGHQQFTQTWFYFRFDDERVYIGWRVVTSTITLSEDGSQYQSDSITQTFDTSGNLLGTSTSANSGQRLF